MFKNRSIQMKVVKDPEPTFDTTVGDTTDAVKELIADSAKPVAIAMALVIGALTLSKIAVHAAEVYIK